MGRKVLKDFTLSDGTVVPAGNTVSIATFATHHGEVRYRLRLEFRYLEYTDVGNLIT